MKQRVVIVFFLLMALPLVAQQARTIGEVTLFGEEQLKVESATKTEIPISKAPSAVTVITAKQIRESGARTVPDLLRLVAGVNVRWNPMVQTVDVRGFGQNPFTSRVLLLIDGMPINSGDTGGFPLSPGADFFPIQNIKRIEVVRGPGSSLYGENAYWGVLNIVTLSGEDLAGVRGELYGGSNSAAEGVVQYGQRLRNGAILGSVKVSRSQLPPEFWRAAGSELEATNIFVKGSWKDLQLSAYRHDDKMGGFRIPFGVAAFTSAHRLQQTFDVYALRYNRAPQDAKITYSADLSYQRRNGMHCAACHAAQQKPEFEKRADHGYQAVGDFRVGINVVPGHQILVGAEGRRLDRGDRTNELAPEATVVNGYEKFAVYAQDQFAVLEDRLHAVAGVRYDAKSDLFEAKTSPRLALVYTPNDRLVVRGGYSTAFRFPTFSELYQASRFLGVVNPDGTSRALSVFISNPGLQPEEIHTFELGSEYQISPAVSAKVDLYRARVDKFVVLANVTRPPAQGGNGLRFENHPAEATITGGELEVRANLRSRLTGFANYSYQVEDQVTAGRDGAGREFEFVYAPESKINLGAYGGPYAGFRGSVEVSWRDQFNAPAFWFRDGPPKPLEGYTLINGRLSYDLPLRQPVRVTLFCNDLLDEQPLETQIGVAMALPGREFFAQIEFNF